MGEAGRLMRMVGVAGDVFNEAVPNLGRVRLDDVIG